MTDGVKLLACIGLVAMLLSSQARADEDSPSIFPLSDPRSVEQVDEEEDREDDSIPAPVSPPAATGTPVGPGIVIVPGMPAGDPNLRFDYFPDESGE